MSQRGKLFIISGPSGAGKSTVLRQVTWELPNIYFSVSVTTRAPRPGEVDGRDYHFVTGEAFAEMIARGELLESARYVDSYYGTPVGPIREKLEAGTNVFLEIEVQGARQVKEKMPESVGLFIFPPSMEALERRLRSRATDTEETIARRLETARAECAQVDIYDYIVINDTVERAAEEIKAIVTAEQCRRDNRRHYVETE